MSRLNMNVRPSGAKVGELVLELDARKKWQAVSHDLEMNS
jgi:hypothetical protein